MMRYATDHCNFVPQLDPAAAVFIRARSGGIDLGREIMRQKQYFHYGVRLHRVVAGILLNYFVRNMTVDNQAVRRYRKGGR